MQDETESIAVILPCRDEEAAIADVVAAFKKALPSALIYVYDNCSSDNTSEVARKAGAIVRSERWPGKGNVVRRMFADVEADVYVMADGDGTYDASAAPELVRRLKAGQLDMVIGTRENVYDDAHRAGHGFGNRLFNTVYSALFGGQFTDIFSGYRVFSRRFAKSFPAISSGFEIETEMSVHAGQLKMPIEEVSTQYGTRVQGSESKLRTIRDALRILVAFIVLFKEVKPGAFFGTISLGLLLLAIVLMIPIVITYLQTGLVPRFPTVILATGVLLLSAIAAVSGLILDSVARSRLEQKRMWYLASSSR